MDKDWYRINNVEDIPSPSLVVFPKRIEENIKLMIKIAGGTEKLRPHIKTHKIAEIIINGEDFITVFENYDNNTSTKCTLLKRELFSAASWCPGATALAIRILTLLTGFYRYLII